MRYRLGCDIGGTFTDFSVLDTRTGQVHTHKRLTTPQAPSLAIEEGVRVVAARVPDLLRDGVIVHGTTLVINAVIERKGARTALVTTEGFRDVLEIGREGRFDQYDIWLRFPAPIVPRALRFELAERMHVGGEPLQAPAPEAIRALAESMRGQGIEAVAICFLHAYRNDAHERLMADALRAADPALSISLSSQVVQEVGEYERGCTTAVNAYTQPLTDRYLGDLQQRLARLGFGNDLLVTLSTGGVTSVDTAREFPVRVMESGPAAGAIGASYYAQRLGLPTVVSFDMGGTTAKTALIKDGLIATTETFEVDRTYRFKRGSGIPLRVPMVDLIEIGAGGGSIARITEARTIQVGPDSVGASPGPACYGAGGEAPAVTDANLVLGYLDPDYFLGGEMRLDRAAAERAIRDRIAAPLGITTLQAAWGIHSVVNENMASAAKIYLAEQGEDIASSALFAFGGCGPVHAVDLMQRIGIPRAIVPPRPGVASAFGMSVAPVTYDMSAAFRVPLAAMRWDAMQAVFARIERDARARLPHFVPQAEVEVRRSVNMRYVGQGYQVNVALPESRAITAHELEAGFNDVYRRLYGRIDQDQQIELVSLAVNLNYPQASSNESLPDGAASPPAPRTRDAYSPAAKAMVQFKVYRREHLPAGAAFTGPAIIEESDSSIVVPTAARVTIDASGCVVIDV